MREIVIAVLLTIAAVAFIAAALLRGNGGPSATQTYETARKPPTQLTSASPGTAAATGRSSRHRSSSWRR